MSKKSQIFREVPIKKPNSNLFDLSHEVKMSGKFGYLYPILCQETLPGDYFRSQHNVFARFAPLLAPIMHRVDITSHSFFVPNRLLTDGWQDFITGGQDGTETYVLPYITPDAITDIDGNPNRMGVGTLWDYLGLPTYDTGASDSLQKISVLPFRAYAKIFNDFYMDPNLGDELELDTDAAGAVTAATLTAGLLNMRKRGWEKDYFTSALPYTQRGAEVMMPLSGTGTVTYLPTSTVLQNSGAVPGVNATLNTDAPGGLGITGLGGGRIENIDEVILDASDVSINDLRRSFAIQKWLEVNARGGYRYVEQIKGHFNVTVPDYRLQRAEYLGGGKQPVVVSEVLATANSEYEATEYPLGDMAGHAISVGKSNRWSYTCQEHGFIITVLSVMPRTAYSQGIEKMWTREDKFDFAWPEFAHIGEQEILKKEVVFSFAQSNVTQMNTTFGYIPRYAEYKFKNDRLAGDFRTTLNFWHLSRIFTAVPALDVDFTTMNEDGNGDQEETFRRIFAVQDGTDYVWFQIGLNLRVRRPLPYFGVPGGL